jgi:hypothetical protein
MNKPSKRNPKGQSVNTTFIGAITKTFELYAGYFIQLRKLIFIIHTMY